MAELTPLDEKLGEVLGLAQAAQDTIKKVARMEGADPFAADLERMRSESEETERRTLELVETFEGKKTAIIEKGRETKKEASEMRDTYLGGEEEALDGFEFMTMAEAGELGHWEIVEKIASVIGEQRAGDLAGWAVGVHRGHADTIRSASLTLAEDEAKEMTSG